jgi:hypothetical protein
VPFLSGSNASLQPELSRNMTVGFVYSPQQVEGLSVGLDWWKVRVDDAIVSDTPNAILDDCYVRGMAERCGKFTRDATTGAITTLDFALVNLGYVETAGYDLLATYHLPDQRWGRLGFTWDTTYVDYYEQKSTNSASVPVQYAGTAGTFRMRSNLSRTGRWATTACAGACATTRRSPSRARTWLNAVTRRSRRRTPTAGSRRATRWGPTPSTTCSSVTRPHGRPRSRSA